MAAGDGAAVSRSQVEQFLKTCIEVMTSEATRQALKDPAAGRPGPKLAELQKGVWDDMGVATEVGRLAVSRIKEDYPDDHAELMSLREAFGKTVDATYLQCLEDRRPSALKKKGKMPRDVVLAFLDACNVKLDMPDVRELLRKHIAETGCMPEPVVNEVHGDVMELLGFEREHGQRCFADLGNSGEFASDREVAVSYARWRGKTSSVCISLLNEFRKEGGTLNVDEEVQNKLLELRAKEGLDAMTREERAALIEKNANKVNVFHGLPPEGRKRYLDRLGEDEKMELAKSEILIATLVQSRQQLAQMNAE